MQRITQNGFCRTVAGVTAFPRRGGAQSGLTQIRVRRATFPDSLVVAQIQPWIDVVAKYKKFRAFPVSDIIFNP
jgi:hypothetical protein